MRKEHADSVQIEAVYSEAQIGARVGFGERPAVLVVDMTVAFCEPSYAVGSDQSAALAAIGELLGVARELATPIFFVSTAFPVATRFESPFLTKIPGLHELTMDDAAATTIHPSLEPRSDEVVLNKEHASPFFATSLASMLVLAKIDTLVLTGCSTSGCIRAAAVDAASHGYRVVIPRECVSDRAPGPHEANLFDIDMKYGDVMELEAVTNHLRRVGRGPRRDGLTGQTTVCP
jgi:nicotinamidase-related amidase